MKVHLRKRKIRSKGSTKPRYSLYLHIYYRKGKRKREFLGIYLEPYDHKTYRQDKLKLAENIKAKRMMELANEEHGFPNKDKLYQNFIEYFLKQTNKREGNSIHTRNATHYTYPESLYPSYLWNEHSINTPKYLTI